VTKEELIEILKRVLKTDSDLENFVAIIRDRVEG
jgi:hypothetical protein